jgi:hypothetical protein
MLIVVQVTYFCWQESKVHVNIINPEEWSIIWKGDMLMEADT